MEQRSPKTQYRSPLVAGILVLGLGFMCAAPAAAQETSVELAAMLGGRIIGAAKACRVNAERVRRVSDRLMSVVGSKADTEVEKENAKKLFATAQAAGADQVRFEKSKCSETHVSFSEMEVKLGRAPAPESDPLAAKRGIPALGALRTDTATGVVRQ
jgi:hypothetical protein